MDDPPPSFDSLILAQLRGKMQLIFALFTKKQDLFSARGTALLFLRLFFRSRLVRFFGRFLRVRFRRGFLRVFPAVFVQHFDLIAREMMRGGVGMIV